LLKLDAPALNDDWSLGDDLGLSFDDEIIAALPTDGATKAISSKGEREWAAAIAIVESASQTLKQKDDEIRGLQSQIEQQRVAAREEVNLLNAQIATAHRNVERAILETERATKRAFEAENWLRRMSDALRTGFGPKTRDAAMSPTTIRKPSAAPEKRALSAAL
jgi:hypothetical protein